MPNLDTRFFPLIFDNIPHGIFTIDASGRITSFNKRAEALTGYEREEVLGMSCSQVFNADICRDGCPLKRSIATRRSTEGQEVTISTKEGRRLPVSISTAALESESGEVLGGVEMFRDLSDVHQLRRTISESYVFEDIVAKSPAMRRLFEIMPLVAGSSSTVLIEGASGTGKELFARAIHNLGPRRGGPFVAINCGALPDTLLESELFGYRQGAFTGADHDKPGRFAMAEGGTLVLDEIGDISPAMQVKLLRVIQERVFEPLGSTQTVQADVRIIAATNQDLEAQVKRRRFRQDLYFRLNVVRMTLPPLVDRREDIPILVRHFIEKFNALQGRRIRRCSERAMAILMGYDFPGNIRELENAVEHAFVVCTSEIIQSDDLPIHILESARDSRSSLSPGRAPLESAEAAAIRQVLEKHGGNRKRTAAELGISRGTLWRKMKRNDLGWPKR